MLSQRFEFGLVTTDDWVIRIADNIAEQVKSGAARQLKTLMDAQLLGLVTLLIKIILTRRGIDVPLRKKRAAMPRTAYL